ncbi:MAG: hypothetical protein QM537_00105 [Candidatus Symbiobacter sp.]|nr:hypothetical protein [Candidatus Symbiobacter sp.]
MIFLNRNKSELDKITAEQILPYRNIVPFIDLVPTFVLFIARLHEQVKINQPSHLLFLSREGKILKQFFDIYAEINESNLEVKTHYFQVSRRSTWLMSLPGIEREFFSEYFKQYFKSSLTDFIKSLTLDHYSHEFASYLNIGEEDLTVTYPNLYNENAFNDLIESPIFREVFFREQEKCSNNFGHYLNSVVGQVIPKTLSVVDVGWKGSIQDNIFKWLNRIGQPRVINGYYLGLNHYGFQHPDNNKKSLVFSCLGGKKTQGFEIFNECKALYEIFLPAGHGAALAYNVDVNKNEVNIMYDNYSDAKIIEQKILPHSYNFTELFENLIKLFKSVTYTDQELYRLSIFHHKRVVFNPLNFEMQWLDSVHHSENFGVFGYSLLNQQKNLHNIWQRIIFTFNFVRLKSNRQLGYWPFLTLYNKAFYGLHIIYKWFRLFQAKLPRHDQWLSK